MLDVYEVMVSPEMMRRMRSGGEGFDPTPW